MDPWGDDWKDDNDGFQPGDAVGRYELLYAAASGGMATVWAARKKGAVGADQILAVKLVSDELHADQDVRAMFLDEARTASRILHPNVVEIYAVGEVRERPYIAMEWIDGESLAKIYSTQKAKGSLLPLGWVLHVASAASAGLHAAHECRDDAGELLNVIHRDVTPQNVMVGFDGTVKVVDFGVAKSRGQTQVSRAGVIKGKTAYFSPEQVSGETIDRRSDLFSFGCLLYLLITGHPPFRGRGFLEVMKEVTTRVPQRPLEIMPDLHPDLDMIIMKALAKDRNERYQTAAEIRRDLEKVRKDLGLRLEKRDIGALVSALVPGVTEERQAAIISAAAELDLRPTPEFEDEDAPRAPLPEDATEVMMRNVALLFAASPDVSPSGPKSGPRPEPMSQRRGEPGSVRRSEPGGARRSDPDIGRKSDPGAGRKSDPGARKFEPAAKKPEAERASKPDLTATATQSPAVAAETAPVRPAEAPRPALSTPVRRRWTFPWLGLAIALILVLASALLASQR